jgi:hypothetical protein
MTGALNDYLYSGRFTKKTIYTPAGHAESYRVGTMYQLQGIGRARLMSIQTDDNRTITHDRTAVPSERVRLFTARLSNGKEVTAAPERPPKQPTAKKKSRSLPLAVPLAGCKGVWLRQP